MKLLLAAVLALMATPKDTVQIRDAVLRLPPGGVGSGAIYFKVSSKSGDRLKSASTKAARHTMLHETILEGDVAKMVHASSWPVPAGGELVLAPGGKHVMLMGMAKTKAGDEVVVVLTFERAGEVRLKLIARELGDDRR